MAANASFDIVTAEPEDAIVLGAVNVVAAGTSPVIPGPNPAGAFRFTAPGDQKSYNGGGHNSVLVCVGHGAACFLSGHYTWADYKQAFAHQEPFQGTKNSVYLLACSLAAQNLNRFQDFCRSVKAAYPDPCVVWAPANPVNAYDHLGDWVQIRNAVDKSTAEAATMDLLAVLATIPNATVKSITVVEFD